MLFYVVYFYIIVINIKGNFIVFSGIRMVRVGLIIYILLFIWSFRAGGREKGGFYVVG